jgi:hypothetical protein
MSSMQDASLSTATTHALIEQCHGINLLAAAQCTEVPARFLDVLPITLVKPFTQQSPFSNLSHTFLTTITSLECSNNNHKHQMLV